VLRAVDWFAQVRPDLPIALHVASAGYGIVGAQETVVPYDAIMGSGLHEWRMRGEHLGMPEKTRLLVESCALTIIALSRPYFIGAGVGSLCPNSGYGVVIGAEEFESSERVKRLVAGRRQARMLGTTERDIGSVIVERLLARIAAVGPAIVPSLACDPLEWLKG
jgi:hypothetical protein